jgi:hypothetical protein
MEGNETVVVESGAGLFDPVATAANESEADGTTVAELSDNAAIPDEPEQESEK